MGITTSIKLSGQIQSQAFEFQLHRHQTQLLDGVQIYLNTKHDILVQITSSRERKASTTDLMVIMTGDLVGETPKVPLWPLGALEDSLDIEGASPLLGT